MYKLLLSLILLFSTSIYGSIIDNKVLELQAISKCKLKVTSGYRTKKKNKAVGGAPNSYHLRNLARDIVFKGQCKLTYPDLGRMAKELFNGVIVYHNHLHVDLRKKKFHKLYFRKKYLAF